MDNKQSSRQRWSARKPELEGKSESEEKFIPLSKKLKIKSRTVVLNFLMLQPFNAVSHAMVIPNHKLFSLLLYNCNCAAIMNCNVDICVFNGLRRTL